MKKETIQANWQPFEKRPTWGFVSVQEMAQALNISPQSVHNWVGRGALPKTEKKPHHRGNKRFFMIARVRAFLEGRTDDEIHWEWIHRYMPIKGIKSIEEAQYYLRYSYKQFGFEKA